MVQARVTDDQYDYLWERAVEGYQGDLSQALRSAISFAMQLEEVLQAPSPPHALREMMERWQREYDEQRFNVFMDEPDGE